MSDWTLKHRRPDGTFVITLKDLPYHVVPEDPLFAEVSAAAEGVDLPPEPDPVLPTPPAMVARTPAAPPVTREEYDTLMKRLDALERQGKSVR